MQKPNTLIAALLLTGAVHAHDHGHAHIQPNGMAFHANGGQWPQQVLYRVLTPGGALFVERGAFTHLLETGGPRRAHGGATTQPEPHRMHAFKVHFEGGAAKAHEGFDKQRHYVNYFLGDDPSKWASGLPVYGGVELREVYPGIGVRVQGGTGIKYDWLVAPGADPSAIVMRFEGHDKLEVSNGLLHVRTSAGDVVEQRPVAWQVVHATKRPVDCRFKQVGDRITFELPFGHDPRYPLVIDPVLVFSSYSGSFGDNFGFTATYDASGHLYGGGMVRSTGYPVTTGVVQPNYAGGENDIAISKFTPTGNNLVWSTYIGGSANEVPHSMVVDDNDELYVLGTTSSLNFPTTPGAWSSGFNGGNQPPFPVTSYGFTYNNGSDVVVVHLNNTATALIGSTYVGGSANDGLNQVAPTNRNYGDPFRGEIILDLEQRPMVVTSTASAGLFTSPDATQPAFGGGLDAYVFRMDPQLTSMLWATYYGGSGIDAGFGIQISSTGEIYITGGTTSTNLPMAGTPANPTLIGGTDGFIARFHPSGSPLLSATYVGTSGFDQSYFVQLNTANEVFVVGQTTGPYPITPGKYNNPNATQFLHKFSGNLSTSLWSTRIGGAGNEHISPSAFLVSNCGQIYFSGWAGSTNAFGVAGLSSSTNGLPVTSDAFQSTTNGSDFYLMMLEPEGVSLGYATFFGGSSAEHVDGGTSRFDKNGIVYQAVCAGCQNLGYPTTPGVWSNTNNSTNCNLGVFKMDFEQAVQVGIDVGTTNQNGCLGQPFVLTGVGTATSWWWDLGDGNTATGSTVVHVYNEAGEYTVMLVGEDTTLCSAIDTAYATVTVIEPPVVTAAFEAVPSSDCQGFSVDLFNFSSGAGVYQWQFGDGATSTLTNPSHGYAGPGSYTITLTAIDPLCGDTDVISETIVLDPPSIAIELESPVALCAGGTVTLDAGAGFATYSWSTGATSQAIIVTQAGSYSVTVTDGICVGSDTVVVVLQPQPQPAEDVEVCPGIEPVLSPTVPVASIVWSTGATTPSITVDQSGLFWYVAVDTLGCVVTDTIAVAFIQTAGSSAVVPNVFSPNNDGNNDTFQVVGDNLTDFRMEIFNRWGQLMYETNNPALGWNGGLDNTSDKVPDGTYYYIVTYRDRCSTEPTKTETGHVTLLR
jgi:gliding motility-associated-like protein